MAPSVKMKDLFYHSRFPKGLALFFLPFYIPLGIVVMVIRIFFALQLCIVLSVVPKLWFVRRLLLRISGAFTGLIVTQEGLDAVHNTKHKMIVANHICHVDSLAFESLIPCFMSSRKPALMSWILKYDEVKPGDAIPTLVFPEGSITNGNSGLLKFSSLSFNKENEPFIVALITISRPYFVQIAPSVLGGNWWSDFLWLLFAPYTHFKIRFVQAPTRDECLTDEEYSMVVQKFMAGKLGIQATKFDAKEIVEYSKRYFYKHGQPNRERPKPITQTDTTLDSRLESMASQVKNVLPQVPLTVIRKDIKKTRCVDTSISNILEGRVPYTQELPETINQQPKMNLLKTKVAANTFGTDSASRHLSFQERKKAFIEAARRKYIAKHNLSGM